MSVTRLAPAATEADAADVFPLTDLGNAERLIAQHGRDLRFVPGLGWHVWDGRRWQRDRDGEIERRMKTTVRSIDVEVLRVDDEQHRKRLRSHATRSEGRARIEAAIALAQSDADVVVTPDRLDADPMLINVANGVLHLAVAEIVDHTPDLLLTQLAPVKYEYEATAPRWLRFLDEVFLGDEEQIAFVQRAVGYSLTGSTREQALFLLWGTGENGKTTFIETIRELFGEYAKQTPTETFLTRRNQGATNDLARLRGARLVTAVESGEGRRLDETLVKQVTGGDTITARHLYREHFEYRPTFKVWLATNHKPEIRGADRAIWRRIHLIPFEATFPKERREAGLDDRLRRELPGILRWAVDGCSDWLRRDLDPPETITRATSDYRRESDVLGDFLDERCITDPDARVPARELYQEYVRWAESAGEHERLSAKALGLRLEDRGFTAGRTGTTRWRGGLRLRGLEDGSL